MLLRYLLVSLVFFLASNAEAQDMRISGFSNFSFGTWSGGDVSSEDGLCVYREFTGQTNLKHYITATSSTGGFTVDNGGDEVDYTVQFKEDAGSYQTLTYNVGMLFGAPNYAEDDCGGAVNSYLKISFSSSDLAGGSPGSYSGTLYVSVAPQ